MNIQKTDIFLFEQHYNEILNCILSLKNNDYEKSLAIIKNMEKFIKNKTAIIYTYLLDDKIVGFIWGYHISIHTIHINYFAVNEQYRNKNIGSKLINRMIEENCDNNFELLVNYNNQRAINFYKKHNFKEEEYSTDKFKMTLERLIQ